MQCPVCKTAQLLLSERQGIEIDYCPQCRGVWLDRGELDKLIERGAAGAAPAAPVAPTAPQRVQQAYQQPYDARGHQGHQGHQGQHGHGWGQQRKKKGGFLGEIFDFD